MSNGPGDGGKPSDLNDYSNGGQSTSLRNPEMLNVHILIGSTDIGTSIEIQAKGRIKK